MPRLTLRGVAAATAAVVTSSATTTASRERARRPAADAGSAVERLDGEGVDRRVEPKILECRLDHTRVGLDEGRLDRRRLLRIMPDELLGIPQGRDRILDLVRMRGGPGIADVEETTALHEAAEAQYHDGVGL